MEISKDDLPKILILEDAEAISDLWKIIFRDRAELLCASTIEEAEKLLDEHLTAISLVVVDGCINSFYPNTHSFVKMARAKLGGNVPILASSGSCLYNKGLVSAGCSHEAPKELVCVKIKEILHLPIVKTE